ADSQRSLRQSAGQRNRRATGTRKTHSQEAVRAAAMLRMSALAKISLLFRLRALGQPVSAILMGVRWIDPNQFFELLDFSGGYGKYVSGFIVVRQNCFFGGQSRAH